jgi:hypothetical protein
MNQVKVDALVSLIKEQNPRLNDFQKMLDIINYSTSVINQQKQKIDDFEAPEKPQT